MKTFIFLLLSGFLLSFAGPATFNQPDFTEAHYYGLDSCFVVQEFNTGTAHVLQPGERFQDKCNFMGCTDSVVTYMKYKDGVGRDTVAYKKLKPGCWLIYRNGRDTRTAAIETYSVVHEETVEAVDDVSGEYYTMTIQYCKTNIVPTTPEMFRITKADAQ